jgi:hypothetical protein
MTYKFITGVLFTSYGNTRLLKELGILEGLDTIFRRRNLDMPDGVSLPVTPLFVD